MAKSKFYIHCAIPYVNAAPHIGHALEFVQTDVIARYHRIIGDEVLSLTGADENALKNVQAAEAVGVDVQTLVDKNSELFKQLLEKLNTKFDIFQRGSDKEKHFPSSQKLWKLCEKAGDIYKRKYKGLYCVGCEAFYTMSELDEKGECYEHSGKKLEEIEEENYFFRLSKYQDKIIKLIELGDYQIIPGKRRNEVLSFLKSGLEDISISRTNERAKNWGVPVPNGSGQIMYVWFDALNIYQSGVGFGWNEKKYKKWWPADVEVIGKGILRFHAIYWIAFLLSAGLPTPKSLLVHDYITVEGQKMSKTLGNVIDPIDLIEKYGADALRLYFLKHVSPFADGDFSEKKFIEVYNADLANGLGNLVSRVAKLLEKENFQSLNVGKISSHIISIAEYSQALNDFRFNDALNFVWERIDELDKFINNEKPWDLIKNHDKRLKGVLSHAVDQIQEIAVLLEPFLPETAKKIEEQFKGPKVKSTEPLFPRL